MAPRAYPVRQIYTSGDLFRGSGVWHMGGNRFIKWERGHRFIKLGERLSRLTEEALLLLQFALELVVPSRRWAPNRLRQTATGG